MVDKISDEAFREMYEADCVWCTKCHQIFSVSHDHVTNIEPINQSGHEDCDGHLSWFTRGELPPNFEVTYEVDENEEPHPTYEVKKE